MPGLVGIFSYPFTAREEALLDEMTRKQVHESFHVSGRYVNPELGVGIGWVAHHGSFSDDMPIWSENTEIGLFFSGEDFIDPADIDALRARGHAFDGKRASYLVHLYEERGDDFFRVLNGRFHGVLLDLERPKAVLFNDRLGFNRIYYHKKGRSVFFASEAKALLTVLPELKSFDTTGLAEMFSTGCPLENRTLFKGISLLPPSSAWTYTPYEGVRQRFYFVPSEWENQESLGRDDYYQLFRENWIRILPRYFRGPEALAVSLTGGKDSRMIMAWAGAPKGSLPCYTFGGIYRECADVRLARSVAHACGQPHRVILLDRDFLTDFPEWAERTSYISDGAMDVSGAADLYINAIARQIAPVRLTGNYGQEMLRGAVAFKPELPFEDVFERSFFGQIRETVQTYDRVRNGNRTSFAAFRQLAWYHYCRLSLELSQLTLRTPYLDNDLLALAFRAPRETGTSVEMQLRLISEGHPGLGKLGTDRALVYGSTDILTRAKRVMQEFTFKAEYAYDYGMPQWVARIDSMVKPLHLERLFLGRHKFYHYRIWYRDELSDYVKEILLDPKTKGRSYLNGKALEKMVSSHMRGTGNFTPEIHRLLTAELVHRQFID